MSLADIPVRACGFDPGSDYTGMSVSEFPEAGDYMLAVHATTLDMPRLVRRDYKDLRDDQSDRFARMTVLREGVSRFIRAWHPRIVVVETPFLGRLPQAFGSLTECVSIIKQCVYEYDPMIVVIGIDPPSVKMAVGVSGGSKDKEDMREAVAGLQDLVILPPLHKLDQHAIDSIAITYAYYKQLTGKSM